MDLKELPELILKLTSSTNMYFYFFNHIPYLKTFTKIGFEIETKNDLAIKKIGVAFPK